MAAAAAAAAGEEGGEAAAAQGLPLAEDSKDAADTAADGEAVAEVESGESSPGDAKRSWGRRLTRLASGGGLRSISRSRSRSPQKARTVASPEEEMPSPGGEESQRDTAEAESDATVTAIAQGGDPLTRPEMSAPAHIQLIQLDLRATRIPQAELPAAIGHLTWEDRGGRVVTARGSISKPWASEEAERQAFMQPVVDTRCGDTGSRPFQPPEFYTRLASASKLPYEGGEDEDPVGADADDDAFAPPVEPHYSTQTCDSYVTPVERQLEVFSKGVREIHPSSRVWAADEETEAFMAKMTEKSGDSGGPPFVGKEAKPSPHAGSWGWLGRRPRKQRQT